MPITVLSKSGAIPLGVSLQFGRKLNVFWAKSHRNLGQNAVQFGSKCKLSLFDLPLTLPAFTYKSYKNEPSLT